MDERAFVDRRRPEWERFSELLNRATSPKGLKSLSGSELADLGKLYRRVTSDLAYAKANLSNEQVIIYLNELAGRGHGILYADTPTGGIRSITNFLLGGFPILFRKKGRYMATAAAIMILASIFAAVVVHNNPATADRFIPSQFTDRRGHDKDDGQDMPKQVNVNPAPATFSSTLMTNNIRVSLLCFAGGVLFGLGTVYLLIFNGLVLGAFLMRPYPFLKDPLDILAFIFPHGVLELTAIVISAGAGLIVGWSLIAPENLSRWDSLRKASKEAIPLMGGVVVMLIIAGCIESFVARSDIDRNIKLMVAAASALGIIAYFGLTGRSRIKVSR